MVSSLLLSGVLALPAVFAAQIDVQVGSPDGQLVYQPEYVSAAAGDVVNFVL
jgi:plastocyanin